MSATCSPLFSYLGRSIARFLLVTQTLLLWSNAPATAQIVKCINPSGGIEFGSFCSSGYKEVGKIQYKPQIEMPSPKMDKPASPDAKPAPTPTPLTKESNKINTDVMNNADKISELQNLCNFNQKKLNDLNDRKRQFGVDRLNGDKYIFNEEDFQHEISQVMNIAAQYCNNLRAPSSKKNAPDRE